MRDIISEAVREMESSKTLKNGWDRGCPIDRQERALIETWVAFSNKVRDKFVADVGKLEGTVTDQAQKLSKANSTIATLSEELRVVDANRIKVGIAAHVDRLGEKIGSDEVTRLVADTSAA